MFGRIAGVSLFTSSWQFAAIYGTSVPEVAEGQANAVLARLTGFDRTAIDEWSPMRIAAKEFRFRGHDLRLRADYVTGLVARDGQRYCPSCLQDDLDEDVRTAGPERQRAYLRAWWSVVPVSICLKHATPLRRRCPRPGCGAPVKPDAIPIHLCGSCSRSIAYRSTERLDAIDLAAERYLQGRLGVVPAKSIPVLDAMPFRVVVDVLDIVGGVIQSRRADENLPQPPKERAAPSRLARGLEFFHDWPSSFNHLLGALCAREDRRPDSGLRQVYGSLYRQLSHTQNIRNLRGPASPVYEAIIAHAAENLPFPPEMRMFTEPVPWTRYVTFSHAALALDVAVEFLVDVASQVGILSPPDRALERFPRAGIDWMRTLLTCVITTKPAAARIGTSAQSLRDLTERGILDPLFVRRNKLRSYLPHDLDEMVKRCVGNACPMILSNDVITIPQVTAPLVDVVEAILAGRLAAVGVIPNAVGLSGILVRRQDVRALLHPRHDDVLPWQEVRARLGLSKEAFSRLVREGALDPVPTGGFNGTGMRLRDVEEFEKQYVRATGIMRNSDLLPKGRVRAEIAAAGVRPTFLADVEDPFFELSGLQAVLRVVEDKVWKETVEERRLKRIARTQARRLAAERS